MHVEALVLVEPSLDVGMLVRGVVVPNHMDLQTPRHLALQLLQEAQPFRVGVLVLGAVDQLA